MLSDDEWRCHDRPTPDNPTSGSPTTLIGPLLILLACATQSLLTRDFHLQRLLALLAGRPTNR
jgi:hypothetical protein